MYIICHRSKSDVQFLRPLCFGAAAAVLCLCAEKHDKNLVTKEVTIQKFFFCSADNDSKNNNIINNKTKIYNIM